MKTNDIIAAMRCCVASQHTGCKECPAYCRSANCLNRLHTAAADTIEAQKKRIAELEEERRWIPVTERMPQSDNQVLVIVSGRWENITFDRAYELASWSADEGWIMEAWPELENPEVTHWRPMPEPVKEG